jgi:CDP-diacylglycerol--glycerol-3-phosphate 3-phosphatidyltransferase
MNLVAPPTGATSDLPFLICFLAAALIPFATYLVLLLAGLAALPSAKRKGSGRRLFGPLFIGFYYWLLGPFFRLANRSGLRPNHITLASLAAATATAVAIATGHFALASVLLLIGGTLDIFDGQLARSKNLATTGGAFLDSTVDRVCDGLIFGGCAVYFAGTSAMIAAFVALIMSFTISYARARGEAFGVSGSEGLMQRADRLVILVLALALSPYLGHLAEGFVPHPSYAVMRAALWLLAFLSTFTAVTRTVWIMNQLSTSRKSSAILSPPPTAEATPTPVPAPGVATLGPLSALDAVTNARTR